MKTTNHINDDFPPSASQQGGSKTSAHFDEASSGWTARYNKQTFRDRFNHIIEWVELETSSNAKSLPGAKALDYGCGSGVFMAALMRYGYEVTGVDISVAMLAESRKQLELLSPELGNDNKFHLFQINEGGWPIEEKEYFQLALCISVLEYVQDCGSLLRQFASALKPGGTLIITVPNRQSLLRYLEHFIARHPRYFRWSKRLAYLTTTRTYLNIQHHQFTLPEIDKFVAQAGLTRQQYRYDTAPKLVRLFSTSKYIGSNIYLLCQKPLLESGKS